MNPHIIGLADNFTRAVLIDFDGARPEDYVFVVRDMKPGMAGYGVQEMKFSKRANDLFGLESLREWLEDPLAMTRMLGR